MVLLYMTVNFHSYNLGSDKDVLLSMKVKFWKKLAMDEYLSLWRKTEELSGIQATISTYINLYYYILHVTCRNND